MRTGNARFFLKLSAVLWLLFGLFPLFGQERDQSRQKQVFPKIQLRQQVRNEEAVRALGMRLPEVAAWYGKSAEDMTRLLRRDRSLWVSPTGRLLYACEMELPLETEEVAEAEISRDHISSFPLDQTFKLHSLPGSSKVIFLDFDGATVTGTAWNSSYNGGADIIAAPFDTDGSPSTFSTTELQRIQNIWKRVAEDYAPFDVDVTTEEPPADALTRSSSSDTQFGNRVVITPTDFYPNAGGVSYVGTFDAVGDYYKTSWAFSNKLANSEKYIAEACSHENGHALGLHHEGTTSGVTYYQGHGDWAPIMGNSYYKNVTQWAKGEYTGANNTEDQLLVIQQNGLTYFADDHGDTPATATMLIGPTSISSTGFIEQNTDVDVFKFQTGAGAISIGVTPSPLGPDLKILAELHDAGGNLVASSSLSNLGASISQTVPAGIYYLTVSGIGTGDPTTGYSDYASLGQYVLSGTIVASGSSTPPTAVIAASPTSGDAPVTVSFSGSGSTDDGTIASYLWNFGDGSATSSNPNPSHTYASAGTFTATLTVTDNEGLTDGATTTITVTKDIYVSALTLTSSSSTTAVSASAAVTIKNRAGSAISGVVVTGNWSGVVSGTVSGTTNSSGVVNLASPQSAVSGTFTFTVTGVSASGYTYNPSLNARSNASITVNLTPAAIPPNAVIAATPTSGDAPVTVTFSGSGSTDDGTIVSYLWNFGDGSATATSANPSHSYTSAGTFTVTLTVTDNEGLTDSATTTITVTRDIYVGALTLTSSSSTTAVSAGAAVTIKNRAGSAIPGVVVTGSWSGVVSGTVSGTTNSSGVVNLASPQSAVSGTFTFTVTGVSASGFTYNPSLNSSSSASITASLVQNQTDGTPPVINITSPTSDSTVLGTVSILVSASDNVAVSKVELYVDGVLKSTSTKAPFTTKWNTRREKKGQHTLQTKAYDAAGNKSLSAPVTVSIAETVLKSVPVKSPRGR
jgi:PKD repeat protein